MTSAEMIAPPGSDLMALTCGLSTLMTETCALFHLTKCWPGHRDVEAIKEALETGQTVILSCYGYPHLATLLSDLRAFQKLGPGESMVFCNGLGLGPRRDGTRLGKAIVVREATDGDDEPNQRSFLGFLREEVARALEDLGRSAPAAVTVIGMPITMKDLCLLHERDGDQRRADPKAVEIMDILQLPRLSWADLRNLLTAPISLDLWTSLITKGQIDKEQFTVVMDARELLNRLGRQQYSDGIYDDIYHALWAIESNPLRYHFYRGHRDAGWTLQSSLFRSERDDQPPDNHTLLWRVSQTSAFLKALRARQDAYLGGPTDDDSLLAIAQHFGMPTHLIDFTRSPRVAAFFASDGQSRNQAAVGAIYCLRTDEEDVVLDLGGGANREGRTYMGKEDRTALGRFGMALDLNMEELTGIHMGDLRIIKPHLPPREDRIGRQQGVFVEKFDTRHLKEAKLKIFRFWQRDDVVFEDVTAGINQSTLLPDGTGLDELAKTTRQSVPKTALAIDPGLARVVMSHPTIIGSQGSYLRGQIRDGQQFLEDLAAYISAHDEAWKTEIGAIFEAHFARCRAQAVRSDETDHGRRGSFNGAGYLGDALRASVERLADWANVSPTLITHSLLADLDGALSLSPGAPNPDLKPKLVAEEPRQRIALACATYLVAWDHLRYVAGVRAAALTSKASRLLTDDRPQRRETNVVHTE